MNDAAPANRSLARFYTRLVLMVAGVALLYAVSVFPANFWMGRYERRYIEAGRGPRASFPIVSKFYQPLYWTLKRSGPVEGWFSKGCLQCYRYGLFRTEKERATGTIVFGDGEGEEG
jgi:hypothetical protein